MGAKTDIEWADSTVNFWSGCTKVSPGCKNCYAETRDKRHMIEAVDHWGKGAPRLKHVGAVKQAMAMNRKPWICDETGQAFSNLELKTGLAHGRRIFVNSLSDWLDDEVPIEWLAEMLDTIRQCQDVTWILCTKRPENFFERINESCGVEKTEAGVETPLQTWLAEWYVGNAPKNIILLTSVENQEMADKRIPELLKIPAACRGLSIEPLLAEVNLGEWLFEESKPIGWVIVGGESGHGARPCNVEWLRYISIQCQETGTPFFCKQLGSDPRHDYDGEVVGISGPLRGSAKVRINNGPLKLKNKKGGDISEWPADLRVREFPM